MLKEKKKFSRQSTADLTTQVTEVVPQQKIERKPRPNIPKPPQQKNQLLPQFRTQQSTISHLTKRSVFDSKSSHQSQEQTKSVTVKYIGKYKQPGVFGLSDKQFINLYKNDPLAKHKIDYVLRKNDQKVKRDKSLVAIIQARRNSKSKEPIVFVDNSLQKIDQLKSEKSYVRCKSQSNLIEAVECQRYKQLIVTHSQAYSGYTA